MWLGILQTFIVGVVAAFICFLLSDMEGMEL